MQQKQGLERNLPLNAYIRKEEIGYMVGSVVWGTHSWFRLWSWSKSCEMEPQIQLCAPAQSLFGILSLPLSLTLPLNNISKIKYAS